MNSTCTAAVCSQRPARPLPRHRHLLVHERSVCRDEAVELCRAVRAADVRLPQPLHGGLQLPRVLVGLGRGGGWVGRGRDGGVPGQFSGALLHLLPVVCQGCGGAPA